VLLPLHVLSTVPVVSLSAAERIPAANSSPAAVFKAPPPVLTPTKVKVNRTVPKVRPIPPTPEFSAAPRDDEFLHARGFPSALVPMGGRTTVEENKDLADAMLAHWRGNETVKIEAITGFLEKHPKSPWRASLMAGLGVDYRQAGYFSRAIEVWEDAWRLSRNEKQLMAREVADQVVADLAQMYAWAGNANKLQLLFAEMGSRQVRGNSTEKISHARQMMDMMHVAPETTFKCGALALGQLLRIHICSTTPEGRKLLRAQATPNGMSLNQLQMLAKEVGADYQMAKRSPGSAVVVPCVVHWKLGHYSALKQIRGSRYHMADQGLDIGGTGSQWIGRKALEAEASGYFLVPAGKLPSGWQPVAVAEASSVWGRGGPAEGVNPNNTGNNDQKSNPDCPPCCGMPVYNIHLAVVSLNIMDTPVGYTPAYGPAVPFTVTYNQREANQPPSSYGNLGPKWVFNWLSVLNLTNTSAKLMMAGGGGRTYAYDSGTQSYAPEMRDQSVLTGGSTNLTYQIQYPDGSRDIYYRPSITDNQLYLIQKNDPQGNAVKLHYNYTNSIYRLEALEDAVTDPATGTGKVTTITYNHPTDPSKITRVTDPFNRIATFQYDELGRLSQITDVIGMTSSFTYDGESDFIKAMTTPYGTTRFEKSEGPGVTRSLEVTDPIGRKKRAEFRDNVDLPQETPLEGEFGAGSTRYRNTFYWDHEAMEQGAGDYTKAKVFQWLDDLDTHLAPGILHSEKSPLESRTWYRYQGQSTLYSDIVNDGMLDRPTRIARRLDNGVTQVLSYGYNAIGKMTNAMDALNRTTTYEYATNLVDLVNVKQKEGANWATLAQFSYNDQHLPTQIIDAAGQTTTMGYNAYGQLSAVTNALGQVTLFNYDYTSTDARRGTLTSVVGPGSATLMSYAYDGFGRVSAVTNSIGYGITINYDNLDRPTLITYPDTTTEQIVYDKLDAVMHKDRMGRWSRTYYNEVRQAVAVEDTAHRVTKFAWCKCGVPSAITDPNGNLTRWTRDLQGRVISKTYSDGSSQTYAYENAVSRLKTVQDASGRAKYYTYNNDDTVSGVAYSDGSTVSFAYEDPGYRRVTRMIDGTGTTIYTYNPAGQNMLGGGKLASVTSPLPNSTITYSYDALGRVTNSVIGIGSIPSSVVYDALGRMTNASNQLGSFSYSYVGSSARLSSIACPNGQQTTLSYESGGNQRLQQIANLVGSAPLSQFNYEYDAAGQITRWTRQADAEMPTAYQFGYDPANQLIGAVLKNTSTSEILKRYGYAYDPAGNRTSEQVDNTVNSATPNNLNQLISRQGGGKMRFFGTLGEPATVTVGGTPASVATNSVLSSYTFDGFADVTVGTNVVPVVAKGSGGIARTNRYQVVVSSGITQTLTYDPSGNLVSRSGGGSSTTYEWDAANRLKAINSGMHRTEMAYDGLSRRVRITEKDNGAVTSDKRFVWDGTRIAEERDGAGTTVTKRYFPQGVRVGSTNYYYTRDHLGSIREMTDESGAIQARYDYDPYGRRTKVCGDLDADFSFTGHYYHASSGLHLALYRAYDADLGRWLSRDPIAENGGINLYAYCDGDPVNTIDPDGRFILHPVPVIALAVVGMLAILSLPLPGFPYALTIPGTRITITGYSYWRLDPLAQDAIMAHERVHSNRGSECEAYEAQRDAAQRVINGVDPNSKAHRDVSEVLDAAIHGLIESYR